MKNELRKIIETVGHIDVSPDCVADDDDLYEVGLTSLNTIQLMLAIEKHFNVEIPDELLNRQLFRSINSLADTISVLQKGGASV
ncbi:MAG: acyl carrier protein [Paraburkholderia sp.]|jgi:acyl carrier protein|nr:acyl carrier protein [Paraburkholderia sp.]